MEPVNATIMVGGELRQGSVEIHDGIFSGKSFSEKIDLPNHLGLPWIIVLHGDDFERHLTSRSAASREGSSQGWQILTPWYLEERDQN